MLSTRMQMATSGVPVGGDFHTEAVDFDGSTEYMANTSYNTFGIVNSFSIAIWGKFAIPGSGGDLSIIDTTSSTAGRDRLLTIYNETTGKITISYTDHSGDKLYYITDNGVLTNNAVSFIVITITGTTKNIYINGGSSEALTDLGSSGTPVFEDAARKIVIGASYTGTIKADAIISKISIRNAILDSDSITALYDSGNGYNSDDRNAKGNYDQQANLKHQWALGKDSADIGADYVSSGGINVGTNSVNVTADDIVTF